VSELEETLAGQLRMRGIKNYRREVRFCPDRRYRADFLWGPPACLIAEVDGGTFSGGRHTRGAGFQSDAEKGQLAALMGYTTMHFTARDVKTGKAADTIETYLEYYGGEG
jgi:very-short-patch-repair endonuclease